MARKKPKYALRRTTRNALIVGVFFVLLPALTVLDRRYGYILRQSIERATYAAGDRATYHGRTFTVLKVIDGDTVDIGVPDGDRPVTRVRLLGVDTPETKHPTTGVMYYGPQASAFVETVALHQPVTIYLDTVGDHRCRYGRLLAYVRLPDGTMLNETLIRQGYGYAYLTYPHSQFDAYAAMMETAIENEAGLWRDVTAAQLPTWLRQKRPDLLRHRDR